MIDLLRKQLDALDAQVAIHGALIAAMRHTLTTAAAADAPKGATLSLPERCEGKDKTRCAEQDGEWLAKSTFADPHAAKCLGCGHLRTSADVN